MPRKNKYKQRPDGMYEAKVQIGYKDNGRPNRVSVYGHSSAEVEKKVEALRYEINHGKYANDKNTTLGDYSRLWLETYKVTRAKNTQAMYKNIVESHIAKDIGHIRLGEINTTHVQRLINDRLEHPRTCEQIKMTIKQIFDAAINDNLVYKNPCIAVQLPLMPKSEKRALTDAEVAAIKKADFTDRERAFIYLIYGCGLRRGEALAITKNDIDLKNGLLRVNNAIAFDCNDAFLKEPKSRSGYRLIEMPVFLIEFLKKYMSSIDLIVLPMKDGRVMTKSSYTKMWASIIKKINTAAGGNDKIKVIDGLTAHIFRHNYCTLLYYSGISIKKAAELMGHSDAKMIMDIYAHLDDKKEKAREKIDSAIAL